MWSKTALFLWVYIDIRGEKRFRLNFPVPLSTFYMLTDVLDDCNSIYAMFSRGKGGFGKLPSPGSVQAVLTGVKSAVLELMFRTGRLDLADVEVQEAEGNKVTVRCSLR